MTERPTVTAIVIAKNESEMIANCLETLLWCDEVLVLDHESSDTTAEIAQRLGARVAEVSGSFADIRNEGMRRTKSDWILYIDADERVVPSLAEEIREVMASESALSAYALSRSNVLYGHVMHHGGWETDVVVRLFKREALKGWEGVIHEHALIEGETGVLTTQLLHLTHRNIVSGLLKTAEWTPLEAQLLFDAKIPKVTLLTILRKGVMEVIRRAIFKKGRRDGLVGWIEALVQGINRMLVYMQVWELQQKPTLPDRYQKYEATVVELWQKHSK